MKPVFMHTRDSVKLSPQQLKKETCFTKQKEASQSITDVLKEYCRETTIHGLRYITRDGADIYDRLCWVAAVISCIILAGVFVSSAWQKFSQSPIVVNVETTNYPLYKIPFPSVTICPSTNVKKRLAEKILARLFNRTMDDKLRDQLMKAMSALSELQYPFYHRSGYYLDGIENSVKDVLDTIELSDFMLQTLPTCQEMFRDCHWVGRFFDCCEVFSIQRSEAGFCYSFNALTAEKSRKCSLSGDFFFEETQDKVTSNFTCTPRRNIAAGTSTGLEVFIAKIPDEDSLGEGQLDPNGTRIMITHPLVPPESGTSIYVPERPSTFFSVKISPSITMASSDLRSMSISQRNCLFPNERKNEYFKVYTYEGCLMECRLKFIIQQCKCYPYFFDVQQEGVPECKFSQLNCLRDNNAAMRVFNPSSGAHIWESDKAINCSDCLPTCHESTFLVNYDIVPDTNTFASEGIAHLDIFYKDLGAIKYRRERAFDQMQLIVSFGGFMGLFLGISLLSGAELIYYCFKSFKTLYVKYSSQSNHDSNGDILNKNRKPAFLYPAIQHSCVTPLHSDLIKFRV